MNLIQLKNKYKLKIENEENYWVVIFHVSRECFFFYFTLCNKLNAEAATGGITLKRCFKNFAKFTGKHLRKSLFLNKVAGCAMQRY